VPQTKTVTNEIAAKEAAAKAAEQVKQAAEKKK
jgi:hypothetical protein